MSEVAGVSMQGGGEEVDGELRHLLQCVYTGTEEGGITQEVSGLHLEKGQEDSSWLRARTAYLGYNTYNTVNPSGGSAGNLKLVLKCPS